MRCGKACPSPRRASPPTPSATAGRCSAMTLSLIHILNGGKIVLSITSTRKSGMPDDCPDFALYRGHNYVPYEVQGFYKDGTSHFVSELNKDVPYLFVKSSVALNLS